MSNDGDLARERDVLRATVVDLLASAHPHPIEHPTMSAAWARARDVLARYPSVAPVVGPPVGPAVHLPAASRVERIHAVTFYAPGALGEEAKMCRLPGGWSIEEAIRIGRDMVLPSGDSPHSFDFSTTLVADRVPDGEGGWLDVKPKLIGVSGRHFIGGTVRTVEDLGLDPRDPMDAHLERVSLEYRMWIVVDRREKFRSTRELEPEDLVLDLAGNVVDRGDDPRHVAYRARLEAEHGRSA